MDSGAGGIVYEYLEDETGETKTFTFPEIQEVQVLGRRGAGISTSVEMIARVGTMLTPADGIITIPDAELRDATPTQPRRGGRKTFRVKKGRKTTYRRSS
jgi:ABC-type thiamine transport system ATPase subunit